jgi:hypothetical protein
VKLTKRQKYDRRDPDRHELLLIRAGHHLWALHKKLGDTGSQEQGIYAALETIWQLKREYREELKERRAAAFAEYKAKHLTEWAA